MDYAKWIERGLDKVSERGEKTKAIEALAKRLGISASHFYPYKRGEIIPTKKQIAIIAEYFGEDPPPPKNGRSSTVSNVVPIRRPEAGPVPYPVLGMVEAGAFREAEMLDQVEPRLIHGEPSPTHPNASPMAWEAHGDSMNEELIFDGTILLGVDFQETGGVLANNDIVVVQQNRGGLIERSVKAVAMFPDRVEFQPRSTNPIHKPIIYKNGDRHDDIEVKVLTIVHGTYHWLRK